MRIISFKPGHDGTSACIQDGRLIYSYEAEKDSGLRYAQIHPLQIIDMLQDTTDIPDVLAVSGWNNGMHSTDPPYGSGYFGLQAPTVSDGLCFGRRVKIVSSTHERSHILCAYGLSPIAQGEFVYVLVWEGHISAFYEVDALLNIRKLADVLPGTGDKYLYMYNLALEEDHEFGFDFGAAGKMMALSAFSDRSAMNGEELCITEAVISEAKLAYVPFSHFKWSPFYRCGVTSEKFKSLAGKFSDRIFDTFYSAARELFTRKAPLLIVGGCGLNCEWNSKWRDSGLFTDVFVPPCANDSGSAIGTAIDAQLTLNGSAKISWSVYSGKEFIDDCDDPSDFAVSAFDPALLAQHLLSGSIIAWVQGRYEIGPRALGHRSLLASPLRAESRDRLNEIKQREDYRPVAPVCLEEYVHEYFDWNGPSPHMLYFQRVLAAELVAVTHVDGSARVQTITSAENPELYSLLHAFHTASGFPVLCNTSLNFKGRGFINRKSDLLKLAREKDLDGFVIGACYYTKRRP